ncbi:MAG: helix-turn-helix domain-containing protein [Defluviitaleaceae bacterium]|nr:helix-turn-helix domain-containing protein [Defluviitaleaceae bacterium]
MSDFDNNEQGHCYRAFGGNLQDIRKKKGFTARDFARFIGKTPSYVGQLESGERKPSLETLMEICGFFGKTPDFMLAKPKIGSTLSFREPDKPSDEEAERQKEQREMVLNMLDTFEPTELNHLINIIKSFKEFTYINKEK